MCKLAFLSFDPSVSQERRHAVVNLVAANSWKMGNDDGVGIATWTNPAPEVPQVVKALKLEEFKLPETLGAHVLVHARKATCEINLANTHPMVGADVYLVHNGIVHPRTKDAHETLKGMVKTTNDSELILKAYLTAKRSLFGALESHIAGWANVAVWDAQRGVLSFFPDGTDFHLYRQDGVFAIVQEPEQVSGVIVGGLGHPYEGATLPHDSVFEVPLPLGPTDGAVLWPEIIESAKASAQKVDLPTWGYTNPTDYSSEFMPSLQGYGYPSAGGTTYYPNGTVTATDYSGRIMPYRATVGGFPSRFTHPIPSPRKGHWENDGKGVRVWVKASDTSQPRSSASKEEQLEAWLEQTEADRQMDRDEDKRRFGRTEYLDEEGWRVSLDDPAYPTGDNLPTGDEPSEFDYFNEPIEDSQSATGWSRWSEYEMGWVDTPAPSSNEGAPDEPLPDARELALQVAEDAAEVAEVSLARARWERAVASQSIVSRETAQGRTSAQAAFARAREIVRKEEASYLRKLKRKKRRWLRKHKGGRKP